MFRLLIGGASCRSTRGRQMKNNPLQNALQEEVRGWFASLDPVRPEDMTGLWEGDGHPSGHPLDGVLENLHWFGKRFHPDMRADALLFERPATGWLPSILSSSRSRS